MEARIDVVKVSIDSGLCRGNQMCVITRPDVFEVDEDDLEGRALVRSSEWPDEEIQGLQRAAAGCPAGAIAVDTSPEERQG